MPTDTEHFKMISQKIVYTHLGERKFITRT